MLCTLNPKHGCGQTKILKDIVNVRCESIPESLTDCSLCILSISDDTERCSKHCDDLDRQKENHILGHGQ